MKYVSPSLIVLIVILCVACGTARDTVIAGSTIGECTTAFSDQLRQVTNSAGVRVQNTQRHEIFLTSAAKAPWKPITGYRETLCGRLTNYDVFDGHENEYDWSLLIRPGVAYSPLMQSALSQVQDRSGWPECGEPNGYCVESEVTPDLALRTNIWFPPKGSGLPSLLTGRDVCVYGPWVLDLGNDTQPEIHPIEIIWWQNAPGNTEIILVQDATGWFDHSSDFNTTPNQEAGWKPWVQLPMMEEIKIPFSYDPLAGEHTVIDVAHRRGANVVTVFYPELADSDDGTNHKLRSVRSPGPDVAANRAVIVEVNETRLLGSYIGVQFSDVCRAPGGNILGYVRVLTAIGNPDASETGYQVLLLTQRKAADPGLIIH